MADWAKLYHNSLPRENTPAMSSAADSTVVTTASIGSGTNTTANNVQPRSGKPARRRSRASRKAPTTMVSTNTNNFRAMVQQFTGFPAGQQQQPMAYQPVTGGANQFNQSQHQVVQPFGGGQVQQTHPMMFQNQQQQQMFDLRNSNVEGQLMGGFGRNNQRQNMDFSGGFLMDGMSSSSSTNQQQQQMMTSRVLPHLHTSPSTEANGGFMLR